MNSSRISIVLILAITTSLAVPSSIAATKPKAAGRSSTAVINTVLNGKGAPSNTLGINGDFYIDTRSLLISGPKKSGKWPAARSLQGANGTNGTDGRNGNDAKSVSTASAVAGPAGPKGERGEKGVDGVAGSSGAAGVAGVPGAQGPSGSTGPAGSGGTGAQGPAGATGPAGSGSAGAQGATGTTGARGETGTVGPSEVTVGTLNFSNISGSVGSSSAASLTGLKAGKSYLIRILIHTYHPSDRFLNTGMILNLTVVATNGSPVITKQYIPAFTNTYRNGAEGYEWSLDGQLVINGALVAEDFGLTLTVTAGKSTSVAALKIDCDFTTTLIGAVL
jgi:hypothetical protein